MLYFEGVLLEGCCASIAVAKKNPGLKRETRATRPVLNDGVRGLVVAGGMDHLLDDGALFIDRA